MSNTGNDRLPPGRQPYDALVGMRVGGVAGGLLGAIGAALTGVTFVGPVLGAAVVGGAVGYVYEKRRMTEG